MINGKLRDTPERVAGRLGYAGAGATGHQGDPAAGGRARPTLRVSGVSVRAGFVVTGTEVLAGRVRDRNGPWLADRLAELGIELAHVLITGDRPERPVRRSSSCATRARPDRHQRRPGADRGRPHRPGRGRVRRPSAACSTRRSSSASARSSRVSRAAGGSTRRRCGSPTASRRWCPRARSRSTRSGRRRGSSSRPAAGRRGAAGPAARAAGELGAGGGDGAVRGAASRRDRRTARRCCACSASRSPRSRRRCGSRSGEIGLDGLEITTCLRRGELEIVIRNEPESERPRRARRPLISERHGDTLFSTDGSTIDEQVAALLRGRPRGGRGSRARAGCWPRGSQTGPAPRNTSPAAWSPTRTRPRQSCWASPPS